jgi:uncharacterized protein YodC (DUF2158 family)
MADTFKVGDAVILKSGSQTMTVTSIDDKAGSQEVSTSWFADVREYKGHFPASTLRLAENEVTGMVSG